MLFLNFWTFASLNGSFRLSEDDFDVLCSYVWINSLFLKLLDFFRNENFICVC